MNSLAIRALENDPDPDLFKAVRGLLQRTFAEVRGEDGRGYNASRAYQPLYRNGARESVSRAILNASATGFGRVGDAGRLDLSYEWMALNPQWNFSKQIRDRAWKRLDVALRG
jgi:hypothetical protein